jgi:hypothetical protein
MLPLCVLLTLRLGRLRDVELRWTLLDGLDLRSHRLDWFRDYRTSASEVYLLIGFNLSLRQEWKQFKPEFVGLHILLVMHHLVHDRLDLRLQA